LNNLSEKAAATATTTTTTTTTTTKCEFTIVKLNS
jgi:hypothetical protein